MRNVGSWERPLLFIEARMTARAPRKIMVILCIFWGFLNKFFESLVPCLVDVIVIRERIQNEREVEHTNRKENRHNDLDFEGKEKKSANAGGVTRCLPKDGHEADKEENEGPQGTALGVAYMNRMVDRHTMLAIQKVAQVE